MYITALFKSPELKIDQMIQIRMFSSFQSLSQVQLFVTAAHQPSLSITNSRSLLKLMSIELVMPSNHLILCHPSSHPLSYKINNDIFCQQNILDFSPDIFEIDYNL